MHTFSRAFANFQLSMRTSSVEHNIMHISSKACAHNQLCMGTLSVEHVQTSVEHVHAFSIEHVHASS